MISHTLDVPFKKILQFQQLVKQYDLRFKGFNPDVFFEFQYPIINEQFAKYRITVTGEQSEAMYEFIETWHRINKPITEIVRTLSVWKRITKFFKV